MIVLNSLKNNHDTKIKEVENKIPNHAKYITTSEFNKLTKENFDERLKQANLASKNDIDDFIKIDEKLRNINNIKTSNKTKQTDVAKKLTDHVFSYIKEKSTTSSSKKSEQKTSNISY